MKGHIRIPDHPYRGYLTVQICARYHTICRRDAQREQQAAEPPQDRHAKGVTSPDLGRDGQQVLAEAGSC
jgi:hypothetical protein